MCLYENSDLSLIIPTHPDKSQIIFWGGTPRGAQEGNRKLMKKYKTNETLKFIWYAFPRKHDLDGGIKQFVVYFSDSTQKLHM